MNTNTVAKCRITANSDLFSDISKYSYNLNNNFRYPKRRQRRPSYERPISSDGSTLTSSSNEALIIVIWTLRDVEIL